MSRVEASASIEARLRNCRDSATSIGENTLAYMIDVESLKRRSTRIGSLHSRGVTWRPRLAPSRKSKQ